MNFYINDKITKEGKIPKMLQSQVMNTENHFKKIIMLKKKNER